LVFCACATASLAIRADSCTWRLISVTDDAISSVADATDCTFAEACSDAAATDVVTSWARSAVEVSVVADASSSVEADDTVWITSPTAASKSLASLFISCLRCAASLRSCSAFSLASRRALSSSISLMPLTALAVCPISSARSVPETSTLSPRAIACRSPTRRPIGRAMPNCTIAKASASTARKPPPINITVSQIVLETCAEAAREPSFSRSSIFPVIAVICLRNLPLSSAIAFARRWAPSLSPAIASFSIGA
jgi:hypothetical protein